MNGAIFRKAGLAVGLAAAGLPVYGEELSWDASWDASRRAPETTSSVIGPASSVDAVTHDVDVSEAKDLDAVFVDSEESVEGALDRRPANGLWIIIS